MSDADLIPLRIRGLLQAMVENEPDDGAADAVTCWMVWKKEAADLLRLLDQRNYSAAAKKHTCRMCGTVEWLALPYRPRQEGDR